MATIKDMVKGVSTANLVIEQKLNSLFYLPPNPFKEAEFVRLLLYKDGGDGEREGLHASAMIASENDFCYRQQVLSLYYRMSQGEDIPVGLKRIFEAGNSIHEKWQRLFIRGGLGPIEDMDRTRFLAEYCLSYTPDAIVKIGNKKYVVEIKSVNTFQFKKMNSHPSGRKQLQFYMYLTGIHNGFVLCEDKNTQEFKVFVEQYDEEEVLPYIERLEAIKEYRIDFIKNKKPPKRICKNSDCKQAQKCSMKDACFNIGMGRVKLNEARKPDGKKKRNKSSK